MLRAVRRRMTWANVALTLALVFAMTGGAFAAKKYLITSTKQISPSVLKQLQGKAGLAGAQGPAGPAGAAGAAGKDGAQGPAGKEGPQGPAGATGKEGAAGKTGLAGKEGPTGKEGSPWNGGGTLPKGATETGAINLGGVLVEVASEKFLPSLISAIVDFTVPLGQKITEEHIVVMAPGETSSACPGSESEPTAVASNSQPMMCIYESQFTKPSNISVAFGVPNGEIGIFFAAFTSKPSHAGELGYTLNAVYAVTEG